MEKLTFHGLLRWKMIILPILTTSLIHFSPCKRLGEFTSWTWKSKFQTKELAVCSLLTTVPLELMLTQPSEEGLRGWGCRCRYNARWGDRRLALPGDGQRSSLWPRAGIGTGGLGHSCCMTSTLHISGYTGRKRFAILYLIPTTLCSVTVAGWCL